MTRVKHSCLLAAAMGGSAPTLFCIHASRGCLPSIGLRQGVVLCLIAKILSYYLSVPSFLCLKVQILPVLPQLIHTCVELEISVGEFCEDGIFGRK